MRRALCLETFGIIAAASIGLVAQTGGSSAEPQTVTVTGCVERGATQPASVGTTANTQLTGPDTAFVLTNVVAEPKPTGTTGTGSRGSISDARTYRLDDVDQSKFAGHVGQTVEISGTVEQQTPAAAGTSGSPGRTGSTATADTIAPKIKVDTIKVVASACSKK